MNDSTASDAFSGDDAARHHEVVDSFVEFWGTMASNWGINRTMAQIHALLYCTEEPLNTDDIMARLEISRGNANMNLRSLTDWELVTKTRLSGSRKDYYVAEKDVWLVMLRIIKERQRREITPVREKLRDCRAQLGASSDRSCEELPEPDRTLCDRFERLIELMEVFEGFSEALLPHIERKNADTIRQLIEMATAYEKQQNEGVEPGEPTT